MFQKMHSLESSWRHQWVAVLPQLMLNLEGREGREGRGREGNELGSCGVVVAKVGSPSAVIQCVIHI